MSQISFSAWKKYLTCPESYRLHYKERLRPPGMTSPLAFGIAIDEALNALLLKSGDPFDVFKKSFEWENLQEVEWMPKDFDERVFNPDQLKRAKSNTLDYACWATLRIKGRMMIELYIEEFYPLIDKVVDVQKDIDGRPGVLDAVLDIKGHGRVLIDHKTSARPYKKDAVQSSTQLALYARAEGISKGGFVVLIKNNSKKMLQVIVDDIPEINKELVHTSITEVENAIKNDIYYKNLEACGKIYGKPCPYIDKCWKNKYTGLVKVKERK